MIYRHKKTGKLYRWLAAGWDVGQKRAVAVYCPDDNEHSILLLAQGRFDEEFKPVEPQPGPEVGNVE